jgi:hypothetical protein
MAAGNLRKDWRAGGGGDLGLAIQGIFAYVAPAAL